MSCVHGQKHWYREIQQIVAEQKHCSVALLHTFVLKPLVNEVRLV